MRLLLDTHALLWWLDDDARLGPAARDLIADPENDVLVSTVSLWEIVVKVRVGKLDARIDEVAEAVERDSFSLLSIGATHLSVLDGLPRHPDHRDPFDHLLIAQAISEEASFLSEDRNAPRYPVEVVGCSSRAVREGRASPGIHTNPHAEVPVPAGLEARQRSIQAQHRLGVTLDPRRPTIAEPPAVLRGSLARAPQHEDRWGWQSCRTLADTG